VRHLEEKKRFRTRVAVLALIWVLLLVLSLLFLSILSSLFASNPQGQGITSLSWSGYIISRETVLNLDVNSVNGSWTVPEVNTSTGDGFSSAWIGIGGQIDKSLIQVGTEQDVSKGQASYYAWYEMLPSFSVSLATMPISPGDVMFASIRLIDSTTNLWSIKISDITTGQAFSVPVFYNSTRSSAEWIVERPTINNNLSPLADFGNISFTDCHQTSNKISGSISGFHFARIEMTNIQNSPLTQVSSLTGKGTSFAVSYLLSK